MAYYYYDNGRRGGFLSSLPPVTRNLIIINVVVFLASLLNHNYATGLLGLYFPASPLFHWWQVITHMFMHGNLAHIFFNMYTLFIFGIVLERIIGSKKFLLFYFVCGLGAEALHLGVQYLQLHTYLPGANLGNAEAIAHIQEILSVPTVGASGAIYGVLMGFAMLFPESRITLIFPPVSLSAKWMVGIFAAIELFTGITGAAPGIAHFAHLGGMLFAWLLILWWRKRGILFDQNRL